MNAKLAKIVAPIAIAVAAIAYFALRPSDESRIRAQLAKLAALVHVGDDEVQANPIGRLAHVSDALESLVDHDVRVSVPELTSLESGRRPLAELITSAPRFVRAFDVDFTKIDVKLDEPHTTALVGATARVRARDMASAARDDQRAVDFRFAKQDGAWIITTITVWPKDEAKPE